MRLCSYNPMASSSTAPPNIPANIISSDPGIHPIQKVGDSLIFGCVTNGDDWGWRQKVHLQCWWEYWIEWRFLPYSYSSYFFTYSFTSYFLEVLTGPLIILTCRVEEDRVEVFALQFSHHWDEGNVEEDPNLQSSDQIIRSNHRIKSLDQIIRSNHLPATKSSCLR